MTREPLMLSDTAMVLLRRYVELQEDAFETFSRSLDKEIFNSLDGSFWTVRVEFHQELEDVATELVSELRLLWSFRDLVPIRHLVWHFIPEESVMNRLNEFFKPLSLEIKLNGILFQPIGNVSDLVEYIADAYTKALAAYTQTKTTP